MLQVAGEGPRCVTKETHTQATGEEMGRGEGKEWRGGEGRPLFSLTAEIEISLFLTGA